MCIYCLHEATVHIDLGKFQLLVLEEEDILSMTAARKTMTRETMTMTPMTRMISARMIRPTKRT